MKRSALLAGTVVIAAALPTPPAAEPPKPREKGEGKPIPAIGTMKASATRAQLARHHELKMILKRQAREARHQQHLQDQAARRKD